MGFADFLATVHRGQTGGRVGEYFGGKNLSNQGYEAFQAQLPAINDAFDKATTRQEIEQAGKIFAQEWNKAGGPMDERYDKFIDRLVKPALNRVAASELESIRRDYGPQTTPLTPQVAPEGQGQLLELGTAFTPQTTPARNPMADPEGAFRMFQATGAKPEHLENIFQTPAKIAGEEAKGAVERERASAAQRKARTIESLPDTPQPGGMISPRSMAQIHEPGLTAYEPQRERPADPLQAQREALMEAQTQRLLRPPAEPRAPRGSTEMQDYLAMGGDPQNRQAFLDYVAERRGRESETSISTPPQGFQLEATLAGIAKDAYAQGLTTPQQIKDFALSRNVILEGEPQIKGGRNAIGYGTEPSLSGVTEVRARAKVVTKGPPGKAPGGPPPAGGGTVLMRAPDGSQRQVPADRVEEFKKRGATVVGR